MKLVIVIWTEPVSFMLISVIIICLWWKSKCCSFDIEGYLFGCTTFQALSSEMIPSHSRYRFVFWLSHLLGDWICHIKCSWWQSNCYAYESQCKTPVTDWPICWMLVSHAEVYDINSEHDEEGETFRITRRSHHLGPGKLSSYL